jgi:ATP-dependent RNA helicase RhlE
MPDDIRRLAHEILHDPVTVQVGQTAPVNTVSHALYPVGQHLKTALLLELLRHTDTGSVLIFTRTKHRAKRVAQQLEKAGYKAASLQGNLSQNRRQAALDGFRDGSFQILVATDIAARGIDVSSISHVINYDIPDTVDAYTHRIGRTGRAAKTGDAFTLLTREDEPTVRSIERVLGATIQRRTLKGFDYTKPTPAHDSEFARPPREPQRHRNQTGSKQPGVRTSENYRTANPASTTQGAMSRPASTTRLSGSRTFKPRRSHNPGR